MGMNDTKEDFCRHLATLGIEVGVPRDVVKEKFRRLLGVERFAEFERIKDARRDGEGHDQMYDFVRDTVEANLLRSLDGDVTVDTSYHLYHLCRQLFVPGKRVLELGCWTGGLTSFVAAQYPQCHVAGVDRVAKVIESSRATHKLPNLEFHVWDYRHTKPAEVRKADVLLCGLGMYNQPDGGYDERDPSPVRRSPGYRRQKEHAAVYFRNWRSAARDGAFLCFIHRLASFGRFVAFIDAAQEAGWQALLDRWSTIAIPSAKEVIPTLVFQADPSEPVTEEVGLSHYIRLMVAGVPYLALNGALALALYQTMAGRRVLHRRQYVGVQNWPTQDEMGIAGAFGYLFRSTARPDYHLEIVSIAQIQAAAEKERNNERSGERPMVAPPAKDVHVMNVPATGSAALAGAVFTTLASLGAAGHITAGDPTGRDTLPGA